ncbi:E3 ubiquitin-protein ligase TRIM33-like isoform X2 [Pomacea canaliculata]|uniref:E3 ubiquitin-protein ligase TRIM33-like isoform X2 n=1 Tax=Pomacea canaliculata TaxID=400727 RepID=UPI000D728D09|nr:E3 ubiquitin-protein ligase TRIM33-like isoform X2 [Pomacea canaliculata]
MAKQHERECAVCTEEFTTPKILPCGHLLCRECVISCLDSNRKAGCPLCKCAIVQHFFISLSKTVDALPTDFVMEALVESARVLSKDHLCCVCEDVRADFICMQCQVMLCSACTNDHKKLSVSSSHDVESVSTVTPERLAASRPALCADHGHRLADTFCFYHRLAVCKSCKSEHRECLKVSDLHNEIETTQNSFTDLTKILVEAEQKLEQAIGQVTSRLQEVDVSEQEDMAQVDKTCDRLQKLVEDVRKKLKDKNHTSHLKIRNSLCAVKTDLSNRLGKVTSHKQIVTRAVAVSPRPALIHMRQPLTDRVNSLEISSDVNVELLMKPLSSEKHFEKVVGGVERELLKLEQQKTESKLTTPPSVLVFHENCGTNIRLTICNTTAKKINPEHIGDGVVVSRDVMVANVLYEVAVDEVLAEDGSLSLGVITNPHPGLVVTMFITGLKDSVIIEPDCVFHQKSSVMSTIGEGLKRLQVGSRVGVLVDTSNDLHLFVDGQDRGVAAKDVKQPCFAVFDMYGTVNKVTALPPSRRI